ncbi:hypothetical protein ACTXT7_011582 [Hymenolepis weldensis]
MNIDSDLDFKVKDRVIVNMLNITGINLPPESDVFRPTFELPSDTYLQPSESALPRMDPSSNVGTVLSNESTATDSCFDPWHRREFKHMHVFVCKVGGDGFDALDFGLQSAQRPALLEIVVVCQLRRSSTDSKKPPAPIHSWHLDRRLILSKLGPDEVCKHSFYEDRARRRKGRAVQIYKATYARTQSHQILSSVTATPSVLESHFSEGSDISPQTVSQGTDPESDNFEAYLKMTEGRRWSAQLKKETRNSRFDGPWLKNRMSDAMQQQATNKPRSRKALAPVRASQYWPNSVFYRSATQHILDRLTPADVRCLIRLLDSINRAGDFQLVFPAATSRATAHYLNYFRNPGYYNLLNFAYLDKYKGNIQRGIDLLKELCQKEVHLKSTLYEDDLDEVNIWQPQEY